MLGEFVYIVYIAEEVASQILWPVVVSFIGGNPKMYERQLISRIFGLRCCINCDWL